MNKKVHVGIVGATGAVGATLLTILKERRFPIASLRCIASARSQGKRIMFDGREIEVEDLASASFKGIDIAFFSAGAERSKVYAPKAAGEGAVVIDNSSAFRMDPAVPLVVPEVNPHAAYAHKGIIANPNCSTIQMVVALKPLYDAAGIVRIVVSSYQSVSGAGAKAVYQLEQEIKGLAAHFHEGAWQIDTDIEELLGKIYEANKSETVFPYPICSNLIPHIGSFQGEDDYTQEELKMVYETKKIMEDDSIQVSATCVRVPVFWAHSETVNIQTRKPLAADRARAILAQAPGVELVDTPKDRVYPLPLFAGGRDPVYVGRIRRDPSIQNGLNLWVVADNLRKGAALNAIQIAELLLKR
ncbi:MAG: aspartate-semialdehyde dehydrogenase [Candidatus Omnitrophica bacterium]|nr:aspartate-semialdehyde dehydrogenase [Candidatus Omnitrophota bacterium]